MPERRFRDMRLTEAEAWDVAFEHVCTHDVEHDERFPGREDRFLDRAKRLLPLWREWGLLELGKRWLQEGVECEKRNAKDREWLANRNQTKR